MMYVLEGFYSSASPHEVWDRFALVNTRLGLLIDCNSGEKLTTFPDLERVTPEVHVILPNGKHVGSFLPPAYMPVYTDGSEQPP
jgi:hypothetical protein